MQGRPVHLFGVTLAALILFKATCGAQSGSPGFVREPYLQNEAPGAVTVCWMTNSTEPTLVEYRVAGEATVFRAGSGRPELNHRAVLGSLRPGASYEYRIPAATAQTSWAPFHAEGKDRGAFRMAVFGDVGDGSGNEQRVAQLLVRQNPDISVAVGDLAYPSATAEALSSRYFAPFAAYARSHVIWPVFGNHDVNAEGGAPLASAIVVPANGPPGLAAGHNYSFDYRSAHCVVIDSNLDEAQLSGSVAPWLRRDLKATDRAWKLVFMHHPPFSTGKHPDTERVKTALVPLFAQLGVDLVCAGHDHTYQRFEPVNGVTYVVTGDGGAELYAFRQQSAARVAFRNNGIHGITLLDVGPDHLALRHVADTGVEVDRVVLKAHE